MTPILALTHVDKRYGNHHVLQDVGIELFAGQLTLLLGPNGAGKSTLLKIIAGLERPDRGQVSWNRRTRPWTQLVRRYRREVVYLHQDPYLFRGTVLQNLAYGLRLQALERSVRDARLREALHWTDLDELANEPAHQLSGGQRQRVALARAWVLRPKVLLLDEPTANLDPEAKVGVRSMLEELKKSGVALMVTTHEPQHLYGIEESRLRLKDSRLLDEMPASHAEHSAQSDLAFDH